MAARTFICRLLTATMFEDVQWCRSLWCCEVSLTGKRSKGSRRLDPRAIFILDKACAGIPSSVPEAIPLGGTEGSLGLSSGEFATSSSGASRESRCGSDVGGICEGPASSEELPGPGRIALGGLCSCSSRSLRCLSILCRRCLQWARIT